MLLLPNVYPRSYVVSNTIVEGNPTWICTNSCNMYRKHTTLQGCAATPATPLRNMVKNLHGSMVHQTTGSGFTPQMSFAYSWMVRSLLNLYEPAVLRIDIFAHRCGRWFGIKVRQGYCTVEGTPCLLHNILLCIMELIRTFSFLQPRNSSSNNNCRKKSKVRGNRVILLTQHEFWSGGGCFAYNIFRVWYILVLSSR